ncbi:MAG: transposase [Paludibacteraceae bacterium]|nr:transposase [Paludibacteraceae bacterium]
MTSKTHFSYKMIYSSICEHCFLSLKPFNKWRKDFIKDVLWLILSIHGKINFLQLSRYGKFGEQHYRRQFEKDFDFLGFNTSLVKKYCGKRKVLAFDPSYLPKSGKHTPGTGYFWSGCAGRSLWGLEIGEIAAIDLDNHTALHLEAQQTIASEDKTLLDIYADTLSSRSKQLKEISDILVVDGYFSKEPFVGKMKKVGLKVVSRFRDDARLQYILTPIKTGKKGRPKTNGGKVDKEHLNRDFFSLVEQENADFLIYTAQVKAVALKQVVKVVIVQDRKKEKNTKIYFSTDLEMEAMEILEIYNSRFQIKFLFRDAKEYTGLTSCQARDEKKLDFHFNIALSAINIAKVAHWYNLPKNQRNTFSMKNIKIINHNALLLERFFSMFAVNPNLIKNSQNVKELLLYGTLCA